MSVEPGFGGQKFMPQVLDKAREIARNLRSDQILSIDGGIGLSTIGEAAAAGVKMFVAGSSIFDTPDYRLAMEELRQAAVGAAVSAKLE